MRSKLAMIVGVVALSCSAAAHAQHTDAQLQAGKDFIANEYDRILDEIEYLVEIPAPPFMEEQRALAYAQMLRDAGLSDVSIDEEGNVVGLRPGTGGGSPLVVSAHIDTVFPEGTDVEVRRDGDRMYGPGVGDDGIGLVALLTWLRAMEAADIETVRDVYFVGTVGEEGLGDLRGVRYLFNEGPLSGTIGDFISVDGASPDRITHEAVGSRRYRIEFRGPGGHSYGAFGIVSPMAAMADAITRFYRIDAPTQPKVTYSASTITGGTSVNTIPASISGEFDMRSGDPEELARLEARFLQIIGEAVAAENYARSTEEGSIESVVTLIGDRPAGATAMDDPLVQGAADAIRANGFEPQFSSSSTDSNMAMGLGIPAITIGAGASGERAHTVDESIEITREPFVRGFQTGFEIFLNAAAIER